MWTRIFDVGKKKVCLVDSHTFFGFSGFGVPYFRKVVFGGILVEVDGLSQS
jgi:hypothetical protein